MKLYYWCHESYGEEATVMAESLEEAQEALKKSLPDYMPAPGASLFNQKAFESMHASVVERMLAGDGYSVVTYEPGQVLWTEVS